MTLLEGAPCPACRSPLTAAPLRWHILTCSACGGVWADRTASERIASVVDRDLVLVGRRAAKGADIAPTAIADAERFCPVCAARLLRVKRADVSLDACEAHGTWFDRDELGRFTRNLDYERKSREAPAPGTVAQAGDGDASSLDLVHALLGDERDPDDPT